MGRVTDSCEKLKEAIYGLLLEKFTPYPHIKICTDLSQFQRLQTSLAKSSHSACYVLLKLSGEYLSLLQLSIEGNLSPKGALHFINIYL